MPASEICQFSVKMRSLPASFKYHLLHSSFCGAGHKKSSCHLQLSIWWCCFFSSYILPRVIVFKNRRWSAHPVIMQVPCYQIPFAPAQLEWTPFSSVNQLCLFYTRVHFRFFQVFVAISCFERHPAGIFQLSLFVFCVHTFPDFVCTLFCCSMNRQLWPFLLEDVKTTGCCSCFYT